MKTKKTGPRPNDKERSEARTAIGAAIGRVIRDHNITLAEAARKAFVHRVQLSNYRSGTTLPSLATLVRFATAFGTSPEDICGDHLWIVLGGRRNGKDKP